MTEISSELWMLQSFIVICLTEIVDFALSCRSSNEETDSIVVIVVSRIRTWKKTIICYQHSDDKKLYFLLCFTNALRIWYTAVRYIFNVAIFATDH